MNVSEQVDALQKRVADLKSSADQARRETNEQIKARIDQAKADIAARQSAVKAKAGQAADQAQSQWKSMKADAARRKRRSCVTASAASETSATSRRQNEKPRRPRKTPPMPWITPRGPWTRQNLPSLMRSTPAAGLMRGRQRHRRAEPRRTIVPSRSALTMQVKEAEVPPLT